MENFVKNLSEADFRELAAWESKVEMLCAQDCQTAFTGGMVLADGMLWFARRFPSETFTTGDLLMAIEGSRKERRAK